MWISSSPLPLKVSFCPYRQKVSVLMSRAPMIWNLLLCILQEMDWLSKTSSASFFLEWTASKASVEYVGADTVWFAVCWLGWKRNCMRAVLVFRCEENYKCLHGLQDTMNTGDRWALALSCTFALVSLTVGLLWCSKFRAPIQSSFSLCTDLIPHLWLCVSVSIKHVLLLHTFPPATILIT